jgi:dTDP-4-amino-4,6-dideoxygalactose transaminase
MNSKASFKELAILGGLPVFVEPIHVGRPNIGDREQFLRRANEMLDRNWLTNRGPFVQEFEQRIADMMGVSHCIAMCNATVALEIAIRAAGLSGEVIVPSFTFIATAHALQWQEITPVFCDIDPVTHCLDAEKVEQMITPLTTGIIGVHVWGNPCATERLAEIADRNKLTLMFDAAHAFGCSHKGRMIGGFGLAEVFSFHATKFLNTFEGGAVVTNSDELAEKIRLMQNFGFAGYDNVIYIGTNGKMTECAAAMGLTNLENIDAVIDANSRNYHAYRRGLSNLPGVSLLPNNQSERCNYQYVVVEVDEVVAGISRDHLVEALHAENVLARRYFFPGCHRMAPYRSYFPHAGLLLPETERVCRRVMVLPTGTTLSETKVSLICDLIRLVVENSALVHKRMERRELAVAR